MVDFEGLDGLSARNDGLERGAELGNVPLALAELIELPPDRVLPGDFEFWQKERFAKRMVRSGSSTRSPSRIVSTTSSGMTLRIAMALAGPQIR